MISLVKKTLLVAVLALSACTSVQPKQNARPNMTYDATGNSVKITNMAGNHGGTGIILKSSPTSSLVLTNSHVCGVVEDAGGKVAGVYGTFAVTEYKKSETHDLCLIKVSGDLMGEVKLANRPPRPYSEVALISGHPALYPNVKTVGHFSGRSNISILVGFKPCTEEDAADEAKAPYCFMLGGLPIIKQYDSVLVTATIMPGSSGSAVYNDKMELSGVVFAGAGDLGYAWTVPYEYVKNFLQKEARTLKYTKPSNVLSLFPEGEKKAKEKESMQKLQTLCESADKSKMKSLCAILNSDMLQ
jgi:S1-C subfamily serine protease